MPVDWAELHIGVGSSGHSGLQAAPSPRKPNRNASSTKTIGKSPCEVKSLNSEAGPRNVARLFVIKADQLVDDGSQCEGAPGFECNTRDDKLVGFQRDS